MLPRCFKDEGQRIDDFSDEFLVVCPRCQACARVAPREPDAAGLPRLICGACGYIREWKRGSGYRYHGRDWYFGLPLWLSIPCCGEVLWAHNWRHLQFIEDYVGALLRENTRDPDSGWSNKSLASRLPRWRKDAQNREDVLKAIEKLQRSKR